MFIVGADDKYTCAYNGESRTAQEQLELCKISINRYQEDLNKYLYLIDLQVNIHSVIDLIRLWQPLEVAIQMGANFEQLLSYFK